MTTFKNNAKYAELLFTYLDVAFREDTPLTVPEVLRRFRWRFKGGSLEEASAKTRLAPVTSGSVYPDGFSDTIAAEWPEGRQAQALRTILVNRRTAGRLRARGVLARLATYQVMVSAYGNFSEKVQIYSGMRSIYHLFGEFWDWAARAEKGGTWQLLQEFTRELMIGCSAVSRSHVPTVEENRQLYFRLLESSRVGPLLEVVQGIKDLIRIAGGAQARRMAKREGLEERHRWGDNVGVGLIDNVELSDQQEMTRYIRLRVGPVVFRVTQGAALVGTGQVRHALGKSDMERLHQVVMATASALVGVSAQAVVGTMKQKQKAKLAVQVAEGNIERIVKSARMVALGDEVLVCKGYRRAYTALLGVMAGPLCKAETAVLKQEASETAPQGVLDVEGFLWDAGGLDAASALNAAKMFKICPAPDVSPGTAMMDRIATIGDGNMVDKDIMPEFERELKAQVLRAYIRYKKGRLQLRDHLNKPEWMTDYLRGEYDKVPSSEIDEYLSWEGDAKMPEVSRYDPSHWKDSGLGADTVREAETLDNLGTSSNMITRLLFDSECPMPGREVLSSEHVIKFFMKAEGHKDPARGIFSANLTDRQAQSWMERAVDQVAREHPSYMIGQEVDAREAKVEMLTARPRDPRYVPLFYSFDISGWSGKMPAEPQRLSHKIWGDLFGGHLFRRATQINEGAFIYLNMDGYRGWFRNTHANLEGFNGKEMTMVLVALLSLSVRRWRAKVVEAEIMTEKLANSVSALLFAYIDDGLSRIDLPRDVAVAAFDVYKNTVIETFAKCGFTVEVSKCFPSDRFSIFLNEVYIAGRHVVHGVRAAMGISAEPTERHTSLVERVTSVSTGVRGAVMAGLSAMSAGLLMSYHVLLHLMEWVVERDPVVLAGWCIAPRAWGGLGVPSTLQLYVSGSGSAFEESVATMQAYARHNRAARKAFLALAREALVDRDPVGILTAPLSGKVQEGYMIDSRVAVTVRSALQARVSDGELSIYATRLLKYANSKAFGEYASAIIPDEAEEVLQEQMLKNLADAHPHSVFSGFARRLEKSTTVRMIVGMERFVEIMRANRTEAEASVRMYKHRTMR